MFLRSGILSTSLLYRQNVVTAGLGRTRRTIAAYHTEPSRLASSDDAGLSALDDETILGMLDNGRLKSYALENELQNTTRAARLRRIHSMRPYKDGALADLPLEAFDHKRFDCILMTLSKAFRSQLALHVSV